MGTRCNIVIKQGKSVIYIYRHWDGYLSMTGTNLVKILKQEENANGVLHALLTECYVSQFNEHAAPVPHYELTNGLHGGDIEHLYILTFDADTGRLSHIKHSELLTGENEDNWLKTGKRLSLAQFDELVSRAPGPRP